jgi:hypothetical protein
LRKAHPSPKYRTGCRPSGESAAVVCCIMTGMGSGGRKAHVRHKATQVHHASRRCGGGVAARSACAAAGDAGDWISRHQVTRCGGGPNARISPGLQRNRVRRARERGDRIPLGGGTIRSTAGASGRIGSPSSHCDCRDQHFFGAGGQGGNHHDPRRLPCRRRPGPHWSCRQPRPAGRQPDRDQFFRVRVGGKAVGTPARAGARGHSYLPRSSIRPTLRLPRLH